MLEETPRSLRLYFGIVSAISFFFGYQFISIAGRSFLLYPHAVANILLGILFGYICFAFPRLLLKQPKFIKGVLIGNFILSLLVFLLSSAAEGGLPASVFWRFIIAVVVFVYLMKSVTRLAAEAAEDELAAKPSGNNPPGAS